MTTCAGFWMPWRNWTRVKRSRLFWVLGIDMAHMGRRYGDPFSATADQGAMQAVAARDRGRIDRIEAGDASRVLGPGAGASGRSEVVRLGAAVHFPQSRTQARGKLLRYEQWNIDEQSVVSFAGISFARAH